MKRDWIEYSYYNRSPQKNGPTTYNPLFVDSNNKLTNMLLIMIIFCIIMIISFVGIKKKSSLSYLKHCFYVTKIDTKTKPTLFTTMVEKSKK